MRATIAADLATSRWDSVAVDTASVRVRVAGGLAAYFGIDPTLVRVGFVVAAVMGWGILAYVVLWIVLPKGESTPAARPMFGHGSSALHIAEERFARGRNFLRQQALPVIGHGIPLMVISG